MSTSLILILSGAASLALGAALYAKAAPRAEHPASLLVRTEARATVVALAVVILFCFGLMMLLKGLFSPG